MKEKPDYTDIFGDLQTELARWIYYDDYQFLLSEQNGFVVIESRWRWHFDMDNDKGGMRVRTVYDDPEESEELLNLYAYQGWRKWLQDVLAVQIRELENAKMLELLGLYECTYTANYSFDRKDQDEGELITVKCKESVAGDRRRWSEVFQVGPGEWLNGGAGDKMLAAIEAIEARKLAARIAA